MVKQYGEDGKEEVVQGRRKNPIVHSKKQTSTIVYRGVQVNVKESFGGKADSTELPIVRRPKVAGNRKRITGSPQRMPCYPGMKWSVFLKDVPSVNHIHGRSWLDINCQHCGKFVKKVPGYTFTTTEGKQFLQRASLLLKTVVPLRDYEGKLIVEAWAHWPDRRARDMNNYAKFIADALQLGGVVKNDKTVLWQEKDYKLDPGVQGFTLVIYEKPE